MTKEEYELLRIEGIKFIAPIIGLLNKTFKHNREPLEEFYRRECDFNELCVLAAILQKPSSKGQLYDILEDV
jgi:hypothetical protein